MNNKEEKKVIGIRADGNSQVGMGHLMRTLSVAGALRREGLEVIYFTAQEASGDVIRERGFECEVLGTAYDQMEEETVALVERIRAIGVTLLLVDSYQVTEKYLMDLKQVCPVIYFDDMGEKVFPVSGIINYNIYGDALPYKEMYGEETLLLLGSKYAPVREEFGKVSYRVNPQVMTLLITMGGSDVLNISGALCERLLRVLPKDVRIKVICGRFNPNFEALQKWASSEERLEILSDVKDMWNCFGDTDIAVTAAGSTMYELATMGVPTICCYYVENQRRLAEGFAARCDMINAGDYTADKEKVIEKLTDCVLWLATDYDKRKKISQSMKKITDGKGANYLACEIKKYMEN